MPTRSFRDYSPESVLAHIFRYPRNTPRVLALLPVLSDRPDSASLHGLRQVAETHDLPVLVHDISLTIESRPSQAQNYPTDLPGKRLSS